MHNAISPLTKLTLLLLAMTTMMSNVAVITTLPHLKEHFLDEENIEFLSRLMITLPSLAVAFLAPFLGHVIHKVGKYHSVLVALLFFSVFGTMGLYLESLHTILFSRFLLGVTIAVLMIVSTSYIGDYFHGEARHKFMGVQSMFISLGGVLFVVGGGVLSDIEWRYAFALYFIGFLLLPFAFSYLKERASFVPNETNEDLNSDLKYVYLLAFALMSVFYILPTQMPFLIINHFGASGTMAGGIIALAFVSNGIGALIFSKIKNRYSYATIYLIGMFIIAVGFVLIGLVNDIHLFYLTSPIMGFGGGILMTNISAWMLSKAPQHKRVKASGYLTSSLFMGQFFSPILTHPVVSHFGVQHFFVVTGVFLFALVSLFALGRKIL